MSDVSTLIPVREIPFKWPDFLKWLRERTEHPELVVLVDKALGANTRWRINEAQADMHNGTTWNGYHLEGMFQDGSIAGVFLTFVDGEFVGVSQAPPDTVVVA